MLKKIAVLITVYNRKDKTLKCLYNLYSQEIPEGYELDVFLTDDGCTDGTPEAIREYFPKVNIISGNGNLFWNRGMYKAWEVASLHYNYDYYMWLNDDTYIFNKCIKILLNEAIINKDKAIIIGTTCDKERKNITYGGLRNNTLIRPDEENREATLICGNILLIPNYVYVKLGKNDPFFHHMYGDYDYGLRANKKGIKCIVANKICGICEKHNKIAKWKDKKYSLRRRLKYLYGVGGDSANPFETFYYKKCHYGIMAAIITFLSTHIHVLFPSLWKNNKIQLPIK